jgi:outer membrane protein
MMVVIIKYAQSNGYSMILDISSPQTPVLWADNAVDITDEIVALYDKNSPSATAPSKPAPAASKPAAPAK